MKLFKSLIILPVAIVAIANVQSMQPQNLTEQRHQIETLLNVDLPDLEQLQQTLGSSQPVLEVAVDKLYERLKGVKSGFTSFYEEFGEIKQLSNAIENLKEKAEALGMQLDPMDSIVVEKIRKMQDCCFNGQK